MAQSKYRTNAPPSLTLRERRPICGAICGDRHHSCTPSQVLRYFLFSKSLSSGNIGLIWLAIFRCALTRQGLWFAQGEIRFGLVSLLLMSP
jgi:hypothetical protein